MVKEFVIKYPKVRVSQPKMLTYADYVKQTPPDSGNYELLNGQIIYMASPIPNHQRCAINLQTELHIFAKKHKVGVVFPAPMDVIFTQHDTIQPDILFLSNERLHFIGDKKIDGAPDLVVEILSPSNNAKEMSYKKSVYEFSGVREYWVINLTKKTLTQYENVEGEFVMRRVFKETDTLTSLVLTGFETPMNALFE